MENERTKKSKYCCPKCGAKMSVLMFMGVQPDGWVCPECNLYFPPDHLGKPSEKPLAIVI